ncbi:hypothetical protein ABT304_21065 [Nocardioides sp. NPDC000445]|uniref:hypothetical protein n=1 Tax=Nocardioides sp. NPDC000445 TaxID=3154257 RepID=UPI003329FEC7
MSTTTKEPTLTHVKGCRRDPGRLEVTDYPDQGLRTLHCVDCAAHSAIVIDTGEELPEPTAVGAWSGVRQTPVSMERAPVDGPPRRQRGSRGVL